jgi:putative transposase
MVMARPLGIVYPGAIYHVTSRGNERKPIFRSDADRRQLLQQMAS